MLRLRCSCLRLNYTFHAKFQENVSFYRVDHLLIHEFLISQKGVDNDQQIKLNDDCMESGAADAELHQLFVVDNVIDTLDASNRKWKMENEK